MFEATGAVCSLPTLTSAAGASGFLNATPDTDGILRRVPLAIQMEGRVYPSLALAASRAFLDASVGELRAINANATALTIGDRSVPLDGRANLLLRFRGGRRTFPFVSAADVMDGRTAPDAFRDKLVFVGATALGTQELVATPHDPRFIGVEVQATVADNLLQGDFLRRPATAPLVEGGAHAGRRRARGVAAVRFGVGGGGLAGLACLVALWGGAWWLLGRWGLVLSPVLPSASVVFACRRRRAGLDGAGGPRRVGGPAAGARRRRGRGAGASRIPHHSVARAADAALRDSGLCPHGQPRRAGRRPQGAGACRRRAARRRADPRHRRSLRGVARGRRVASAWCVNTWISATSSGRRPTP